MCARRSPVRSHPFTPSSGSAIPGHAPAGGVRVEQRGRAVLADVSDQAAVDAVADELPEPRREPRGELARDPELLVLLLPDEARAVVHRDPDAAPIRLVGAALVPQAAVVDE